MFVGVCEHPHALTGRRVGLSPGTGVTTWYQSLGLIGSGLFLVELCRGKSRLGNGLELYGVGDGIPSEHMLSSVDFNA